MLNTEYLFVLLVVLLLRWRMLFPWRGRHARSFHLFLMLKTIQSLWHKATRKPVEGESRLSSVGEDLRKKKKGPSFPSNLLHHIPKIQWIRPYTPELTITVGAIGAWNISYHLHFISAIHAKLSRSGSFLKKRFFRKVQAQVFFVLFF